MIVHAIITRSICIIWSISLYIHAFWDTTAILVCNAPNIAPKCRGKEKKCKINGEMKETTRWNTEFWDFVKTVFNGHDYHIRSQERIYRIHAVISTVRPSSLRKCFQFRLKRSITVSIMSRLMLCNLGNTSAAGNDTNNNANTNSSMEDDDSYPLPTIYRYVNNICHKWWSRTLPLYRTVARQNQFAIKKKK